VVVDVDGVETAVGGVADSDGAGGMAVVEGCVGAGVGEALVSETPDVRGELPDSESDLFALHGRQTSMAIAAITIAATAAPIMTLGRRERGGAGCNAWA
jgi:hypothetical protein